VPDLKIDFSTRFAIPARVLFRELAGEAVLLQTESGLYFGLDEIGTRIWSLLQQHGELGRVYEQMLEEFAVSPERLREDLLQFVATLTARGLLEAEGGAGL
jgi:hypothetical protein